MLKIKRIFQYFIVAYFSLTVYYDCGIIYHVKVYILKGLNVIIMKSKKKASAYPAIMSMEFDWVLFILAIGISIFGIINVYSATRTTGSNSNVIVQTGAFIIGVLCMIGLSRFDYEQFRNMVKPVYGLSIVLLIAVLVFGVAENWGARSWIRIGPIGIQPSELAKICYIITFPHHLTKVEKKINQPLVLLGLCLHLAVPVGLIMLQPDLGSVLVFVFMFICMLFTAKISWKYIIPVGALFAASTPFIYKYALNDYQKERILVFFNPERDPLYRGYNVIQSKIAVGSGGLWGKGFLHGTQNQMGYLPTKSTDFIFSVVSEEWGFIGAFILVIALFALVYRCFKIAQKADNSYGKYICVGTAAMFLFHIFENVGMCIGLMPVTGIPLPLVSYGGTSMVANMIALGLVLSVNYHNKPRTVMEVY